MGKSLSANAGPIIYHKSFRKLFEKTVQTKTGTQTRAGSITACILLQHLENCVLKYRDGFYKFLSPCDNNPNYRVGESWIEELKFTEDEFRQAFQELGTVWKSKQAFDQAEDKFLGKFYASYIDRIHGLTFYFRNHESLDLRIGSIAGYESIQQRKEIAEKEDQ